MIKKILLLLCLVSTLSFAANIEIKKKDYGDGNYTETLFKDGKQIWHKNYTITENKKILDRYVINDNDEELLKENLEKYKHLMDDSDKEDCEEYYHLISKLELLYDENGNVREASIQLR